LALAVIVSVRSGAAAFALALSSTGTHQHAHVESALNIPLAGRMPSQLPTIPPPCNDRRSCSGISRGFTVGDGQVVPGVSTVLLPQALHPEHELQSEEQLEHELPLDS